MAWSLLAIPGVGTIATIAGWATKVVNNFRYLKGIDGVITTQSGLEIDNSLGSEYLKLPLLSTAECTTVLAAEGQVAHDEATHRIKLHDGTAVRSVVTTADVDDAPVNSATTDPISSNWAYDHLGTLTTAGDMGYATGAGNWSRLGIGTTLQYLRTNAGATAPEWTTLAAGKEFFIPCTYAEVGTMAIYSATEWVGAYCDAADERGHIMFRVPSDFTSITTAVVLALTVGADATADISCYSNYGAKDEASDTHSENKTDYSLDWSTSNRLREVDVSVILSALAANDYVSLALVTEGTDEGCYVIGVYFKYA